LQVIATKAESTRAITTAACLPLFNLQAAEVSPVLFYTVFLFLFEIGFVTGDSFQTALPLES